MLHRVVTVLGSVVLLVAGFVSPAAAAPVRTELTEAMKAAVAAGKPGVLAVVEDGRGRWASSAGAAYLHTPIEPDSEGRFRIGSVSKTFTATLVLQLTREGRVGLDDAIDRYLPGLLPYDAGITVRQLLQHTSGLPRTLPPDRSWASRSELNRERFVRFTPAEVVRQTTTQPLLFEPGTDWSYSNTGYTVLAMLVETVTGHRYEHALQSRILSPLGLTETTFVRNFPALIGAAARGYERLAPAPYPLTDITTIDLSRFIGAGTMISTGAELNRFFEALLGGELLDPRILEAMKTTVPTGTPGLQYGLGLMRLSLEPLCGNGPTVWGHNGSVPGYSTWSMHTASGAEQITTMSNQSITGSPEARATYTLVMVNEFCTPDAGGVGAAERLSKSLAESAPSR